MQIQVRKQALECMIRAVWYNHAFHFFSSVASTMMECCHVNNMSPQCAVAGLSPGCVDPDVHWMYNVHCTSVNLPQQCGMRASTRSPPMSGQSECCPMTRWWSCLGSTRATCPKKHSHLSNKVGNWRIADSLHDSSIVNMSGLQDLKNVMVSV